jgi:hypothetical protein
MGSGESCVEIYRRKKTGELLVQAFWEKVTMPGATTQGDPVPLASDASDEEVLKAVLAALAAYSNHFDPKKTRRQSESEYSRFLRDHDVVFVERWPTGETLIGPMKRSAGGLEGTKQTTKLRPGAPNSDIIAAIRKALSQAGKV